MVPPKKGALTGWYKIGALLFNDLYIRSAVFQNNIVSAGSIGRDIPLQGVHAFHIAQLPAFKNMAFCVLQNYSSLFFRIAVNSNRYTVAGGIGICLHKAYACT